MQSSQHLDTRRFSQLSASLERHMAAYGYQTVETLIIQPADLFLTRAGDQIIDHLFTFERRGQQYALRPEFTASAAALYTQRCSNGEVARWQFHGAVFEDHPHDTIHQYQRYGIGAELLGMAGRLAEAEIIAMAAHGLTQQGISNWILTIGDVQLMRHLLAGYRLDSRAQRFLLSYLPALKNPAQGKPYVADAFAKLIAGADTGTDVEEAAIADDIQAHNLLDVVLDATQRSTTMGGRTREDIMRRLIRKRQRLAERDQFLAALDFLAAWTEINTQPDEGFSQILQSLASNDATAHAIVREWQHLIALLEAFGISKTQIRVQPALSRNWDYYTGMVFEFQTAEGVDLGGGGRYDELARLLGGSNNVSAVGFTYYADQVLSLVSPHTEPAASAWVIAASPDAEAHAVRWSHALRQRGISTLFAQPNALSALVLTVQSDGAVQWNNRLYTLEAIDQLTVAMEQLSR